MRKKNRHRLSTSLCVAASFAFLFGLTHKNPPRTYSQMKHSTSDLVKQK